MEEFSEDFLEENFQEDCQDFSCSHCPESSFKKPIRLALHVYEEHRKTMPRPFECIYVGCNKTFGTKATRAHHHTTHTKNTYLCSVVGCEEKFNSFSQVKQHKVKDHHFLVCPICKEIFINLAKFNFHKSDKHRKIKFDD